MNQIIKLNDFYFVNCIAIFYFIIRMTHFHGTNERFVNYNS